MEAKTRNQKLILAGLLLGLLTLNTPWKQYFQINLTSAVDMASMTSDAQELCRAGITDISEGRRTTNNARAALQAKDILDSTDYSFTFGPEEDTQLYGRIHQTQASVSAPGRCPEGQAFCEESERTGAGEPEVLRTFTVNLGTEERTTTEADNGIICRECHRGGNEFDFTVSDDLSMQEKVYEVCWQFQLKRSNAYFDMKDNNELLTVAQKEAKIESVAERLEELQKECKANKEYRASDDDVDGGDMVELLEMFSWDEEEALKTLDVLADIDVDGDYDEDDVHEVVQDLAITSKRDFVQCHKGHMAGMSDEEEDEYFHDNLLDKYREWMVSDDEDTRDYAYASLDSWQSHSGFSKRFRNFLKGTESRGKRTHAYQLQLAEINKDYDRLKARYAGDSAALRNLDQIYEGVRASAEQSYRLDMHNSLAGLPGDSDILTSAMDFWGDHADSIRNEIEVDSTIVADLDFEQLARTQIENPQRFSRWEYSRGNNVSERIEEIMAGALRDSNRMLDRFNDRRVGTDLDRFRLDTQFAGDTGRYPRYSAPPSTRTRNSFL
ncbi:MAG: hypothetical protein AAF202_00800 [Pseudomonadota bacterium]